MWAAEVWKSTKYIFELLELEIYVNLFLQNGRKSIICFI